MKNALDNNGYKDKYTFNGFGTSELGGKLLAEGKNIEADMVTMSTFYLDSAQQQNKMFQKLDFPIKTLDKFGDYAAPITSQEGAIIMNTDLMKKYNLSTPTCLKDLTKKEYKGYLAITDVKSSSTAWLAYAGSCFCLWREGGSECIKTDLCQCRQTILRIPVLHH